MPHVAVIIPYYQREPGILRRALCSVLAQRLPPLVSLRAVVVDDGSPVPVATEIEGLTFEPPYLMTVVRKPNGGVASARDAGLKSLDNDVDYVAFLDSDDYWRDDHVAQALRALGRGGDLYFTDHGRVSYHASHFQTIAFPPADLPKGCVERVADTIYTIDARFFFSLTLRSSAVHISTVVYRRAIHPAAGFNLALRMAGEDLLFILQIAAHSTLICFNRGVCVTCGEGINIYYGNFDWNDEGHLRRHMADVLAAYALRSGLELSVSDARQVRKRIGSSRREFAYFSLRWLVKTRKPWSRDLVNLTRADAGFFSWYPFYLFWGALLGPPKRQPGP